MCMVVSYMYIGLLRAFEVITSPLKKSSMSFIQYILCMVVYKTDNQNVHVSDDTVQWIDGP